MEYDLKIMLDEIQEDLYQIKEHLGLNTEESEDEDLKEDKENIKINPVSFKNESG